MMESWSLMTPWSSDLHETLTYICMTKTRSLIDVSIGNQQSLMWPKMGELTNEWMNKSLCITTHSRSSISARLLGPLVSPFTYSSISLNNCSYPIFNFSYSSLYVLLHGTTETSSATLQSSPNFPTLKSNIILFFSLSGCSLFFSRAVLPTYTLDLFHSLQLALGPCSNICLLAFQLVC